MIKHRSKLPANKIAKNIMLFKLHKTKTNDDGKLMYELEALNIESTNLKVIANADDSYDIDIYKSDDTNIPNNTIVVANSTGKVFAYKDNDGNLRNIPSQYSNHFNVSSDGILTINTPESPLSITSDGKFKLGVNTAIFDIQNNNLDLNDEGVYAFLKENDIFTAGSNITITPNDTNHTFTFASSGGGGGSYTFTAPLLESNNSVTFDYNTKDFSYDSTDKFSLKDEGIYGINKSVLVAGSNITFTNDDTNSTITINGSAGGSTYTSTSLHISTEDDTIDFYLSSDSDIPNSTFFVNVPQSPAVSSPAFKDSSGDSIILQSLISPQAPLNFTTSNNNTNLNLAIDDDFFEIKSNKLALKPEHAGKEINQKSQTKNNILTNTELIALFNALRTDDEAEISSNSDLLTYLFGYETNPTSVNSILHQFKITLTSTAVNLTKENETAITVFQDFTFNLSEFNFYGATFLTGANKNANMYYTIPFKGNTTNGANGDDVNLEYYFNLDLRDNTNRINHNVRANGEVNGWNINLQLNDTSKWILTRTIATEVSSVNNKDYKKSVLKEKKKKGLLRKLFNFIV